MNWEQIANFSFIDKLTEMYNLGPTVFDLIPIFPCVMKGDVGLSGEPGELGFKGDKVGSYFYTE